MQLLRPCLLVASFHLLWLSASSTATLSSSDCQVVAGTGQSGTGTDELSYPTGIAVDPSNDVFVVDGNNNRVMRFADGDTTGTQVAGYYSSGLGNLGKPVDVKLTSGGNLVISDLWGDRVVEWVPGATSGQLRASTEDAPRGIALSSSGDLFVANYLGSHAQRFAAGSTTGADWSGKSGVSPMDVDVDNDGQVYLLGKENGIWRLPATQELDGGELVALAGGYGTALNQARDPKFFKLDWNKHIWVSDNNNQRVLRCYAGASECELILDGVNHPAGIDFSAGRTHFYVVEERGHQVLKCPVPPELTFTTTTATTSTATTSTVSTSTATTSTRTTSTITTSTISTSTATTTTSATVTASTTTSTVSTSTATTTTSTTATATTTTATTTTSSNTETTSSSSSSTSTSRTSTATTTFTTTTLSSTTSTSITRTSSTTTTPTSTTTTSLSTTSTSTSSSTISVTTTHSSTTSTTTSSSTRSTTTTSSGTTSTTTTSSGTTSTTTTSSSTASTSTSSSNTTTSLTTTTSSRTISTTTSSSTSSLTSTSSTSSSDAASRAPVDQQQLSPSEAAKQLLGEVAAVSPGLLDHLQANGAQAQATAPTASGTVTALRLGTVASLSNSSGDSGSDSVSVSVATAEGVVQLTLPSTVFTRLQASSEPGDSLVLLVSSFSPASAASTGGQQEVRGSSRVQFQVVSTIAIDLRYLLSRESPVVQDLEDPIVFEIPGANYSAGLRCAYLEEVQRRWSFTGVETPEEGNEVDRPLVCNTRHLSFFAAIWEAFVATLQCAQFGLLSAEAIKNLFTDSAWLSTTSAWICWGIFLGFDLAFGLATLLDARRERSQCWRDEFFLVAAGAEGEAPEAETLPEMEGEGEPEPLEANQAQPSFVKRAFVGGLLLGGGCLRCLYESSAVMEALDEIVSSWFEYWGQLRSACDTFCEVLAEGSGASAAALVQRAAATFLMASSRRMVACSLGISNAAVAFVLEDEDLQEFLVEDHGSGVLGTRADDWRTSEDQRVAWSSLHDTVVHHVLEHTQHHTICGLPAVVLNFFLYHNPVGALFVQDIFHSCKKRVLLLAVDFMGALALSCAFFDAAGLVRGKPIGQGQDCGGEGFAWRIGRFLAIATGALIMSALPVALIESLQTKGFRKVDYAGSAVWEKQLRVWATQDLMVWVVGLLYVAFCSFFVLVFLASIGPEDHEEWSFAGFVSLAEEFVLLPASLALVVPTMTIAFLHLHTRVHHVDRAAVLRRTHETFLKETNMMLPVMRV